VVANRRFAVHEIRNIIVRMRLGESDRQMAKAGLIGRSKAARIRSLANEKGWLDKSLELPANLEIESLVMKPSKQKISGSIVKPYAKQVKKWIDEGITATVIHRSLVGKYGFAGSYDCVKRYVARLKQKKPVTIILDFKPGEAVQVDFGTGPVLLDTRTGEYVKTWFFVMTLAYSRHQYLEFVLNQKVETWLGCHRRAFEFFGGVPGKAIIDNPKCAITKACYQDPEVQRSYAEYAEGYGFLISPCPVADPKKKGIVESGVKYVKMNFLPLLEPRDLSDLNWQAHNWVMGNCGQQDTRNNQATSAEQFY
jgi:transposase